MLAALFTANFVAYYFCTAFRNRRAAIDALKTLDCFVGEVNIVGSKAESVKLRFARNGNDIQVNQLCCTEDGLWFEHSFAVNASEGVVKNQRAALISDVETKAWLVE